MNQLLRRHRAGDPDPLTTTMIAKLDSPAAARPTTRERRASNPSSRRSSTTVASRASPDEAWPPQTASGAHLRNAQPAQGLANGLGIDFVAGLLAPTERSPAHPRDSLAAATWRARSSAGHSCSTARARRRARPARPADVGASACELVCVDSGRCRRGAQFVVRFRCPPRAVRGDPGEALVHAAHEVGHRLPARWGLLLRRVWSSDRAYRGGRLTRRRLRRSRRVSSLCYSSELGQPNSDPRPILARVSFLWFRSPTRR